jgi:acetyl-CoA acetyltransferase
MEKRPEFLMNEAFVVAGARTPIGRLLSAFRDVSAPQLGAAAIRELSPEGWKA